MLTKSVMFNNVRKSELGGELVSVLCFFFFCIYIMVKSPSIDPELPHEAAVDQQLCSNNLILDFFFMGFVKKVDGF